LFSSIAIIGLPPFGIFISELMLLISTAQNSLWLAGITLFGLIVALAGIMRHIHLAVFGHASSYVKSQINLLPAYLQLGLVLILGLYLPTNLANLLQQATILIAGKI
jgi:formate hydrogenlyase subunit 3/multisubunit Na+/H+ antiporter MnhD subunit